MLTRSSTLFAIGFALSPSSFNLHSLAGSFVVVDWQLSEAYFPQYAAAAAEYLTAVCTSDYLECHAVVFKIVNRVNTHSFNLLKFSNQLTSFRFVLFSVAVLVARRRPRVREGV